MPGQRWRRQYRHLAELAYGLPTIGPVVSTAGEARYQQIVAVFDPIPYYATAVRAYGALAAVVRAAGRKPAAAPVILLLASVAMDESILLLTRNPGDFEGLHSSVQIIPVEPSPSS